MSIHPAINWVNTLQVNHLLLISNYSSTSKYLLAHECDIAFGWYRTYISAHILQAKQKSKLAPRFNHIHNINIPIIHEEQYSDYELGTDDPESWTNLDQIKFRLSFESALRSPSMCNVIDSTQDQELSTSPRKNAAKLKSKSPQKQNLKLTVSEVRDKKVTQSTHRHHNLSKDKSFTN